MSAEVTNFRNALKAIDLLSNLATRVEARKALNEQFKAIYNCEITSVAFRTMLHEQDDKATTCSCGKTDCVERHVCPRNADLYHDMTPCNCCATCEGNCADEI